MDKHLVARGGVDIVATAAGARPPAVASLAPGTRLADRYKVIRLLGRGGMGEVYEVLDLALGIPVALKTIHLSLARDPLAVRRFKREILLARSITHGSVCRIYDLGWAEDRGREVSFLTMELLGGEPLAARLAARGRLAPGEALPLVRQMAAALEAAHRAGVVHRDFKSGNVMLVPGPEGERAVVTDFGLALPAAGEAAEKLTGEAAGTPAYMAPEQVRREPLGPAADIYALGVVLFEMATGRLPFHGDSPLATAAMRLDHDPPPPRSLVPDLDPRWEETILRCLARDPERRFARAEDVVAALQGERRGAARQVLPGERDRFVGRESELAELDRQIEGGSRLVTLLGPAGVGKTRLSVRYGHGSGARFPGGVWLCDLTQARSLNGIAVAVATALDVPLGQGDPIVQLGHAIAARGRCLVILDNFEQVVEHAAATAGRWLERAREASFLVSSRERLRLAGEVLLSIGPLEEEAAVKLFVARAAAARPGFVLDPGNEETVRRVVRLLEGLPLAIELAAARAGVMAPAQILERLADRFRLLARGHENGRHASLRAAFAQASVFEGGFSLEAAEEVLDLSAWPEAGAGSTVWTVDVVQALVDKSLLRTWVPAGSFGEPRFGMYVSLQEYARGKLREQGAVERGGSGPEAARRAEARHGACYARFGTEKARDALCRHGGVQRMRALEREIENLVVACRRAVARGEGETAGAAYGAAFRILQLRGPYAVAMELGDKVLEMVGLAPAVRGRALLNLGRACREAGQMEEARAHLEQAGAIHWEVGDRSLEGVLFGELGGLHYDKGRMEEARAHYDESLAISREVGDRGFEGIRLCNLGNVHFEQGRMEEARAHYDEALAISRQVGDRSLEGVLLCNLGNLHLEQGRMEEARARYEQALAIHREDGHRHFEGLVLGNLGNLHLEQARLVEAGACYEQALAIVREIGNRRFEGILLARLGSLHLEQGRTEEARAAFALSEQLLRDQDNRVELGKLLCHRGRAEAAAGDLERARAALAEAESLAAATGAGTESELGRLLRALRQKIDETADPPPTGKTGSAG